MTKKNKTKQNKTKNMAMTKDFELDQSTDRRTNEQTEALEINQWTDILTDDIASFKFPRTLLFFFPFFLFSYQEREPTISNLFYRDCYVFFTKR